MGIVFLLVFGWNCVCFINFIWTVMPSVACEAPFGYLYWTLGIYDWFLFG